MKRTLLLLFGILLLTGCTTHPQTQDKLYPDVKVSRLLRVIDGDTFRCDIDEHSAIAGKNISIRLRGINTPELRSKNPEERKSWTIFLFSRKILSTSKWRIFRVSKGGAFSLLEKFSGRNWNFILTQKEFEHRENGRKEIRTSDLYS